MSRVDVVVPCHNYARFLRRCVESVLGQQGVEVRVLVIDDASRDESAEVGRRLAELHPRVELRRHEANRGHIATYNEGLLEWAAAPYSLLLSADDMLAPEALLRATRLMDQHGDIGMTYGMAEVLVEEEEPPAPPRPASDENRVLSGSEFLQFCFTSTHNPVPTPTAVVRTELQQRLGGYRADLPHAGDLEMWMRFAVHGSVGVLRSVQGYYRWHAASMSSGYYGQPIDDRRQFAEACRLVLERWGARYQESGRWLESISRILGDEALWVARNAFERAEAEECRAWLRFAAEIHPGIRRSGLWWRLAAKRLVGPSLWRAMRPVLGRLVSMTDPPSKEQEAARFRLGSGQQIGWWPGSE